MTSIEFEQHLADLSQYGWLVATSDCGSPYPALVKDGTKKIIELTGDHPNIQTKVVKSKIEYYYADELVEQHNKRLRYLINTDK